MENVILCYQHLLKDCPDILYCHQKYTLLQFSAHHANNTSKPVLYDIHTRKLGHVYTVILTRYCISSLYVARQNIGYWCDRFASTAKTHAEITTKYNRLD